LDKLSTPDQPIPYIIRTTIRYLLTEEAVTTEGLFRISGSQNEIHRFQKLFDEGKEVNFKDFSCHDVAGLLKEFFRKLPESVIPTLYNNLVRTYVDEYRTKENADEQHLIESLKQVVEQLPKENLAIFQTLTKFLSIIVSYSDINSMTIDNIIKCIVPSMGCSPAIFYYAIIHNDLFFGDKQAPTEYNDNDRRGRRGRDQQGWYGNRANRGVGAPLTTPSVPGTESATVNVNSTEPTFTSVDISTANTEVSAGMVEIPT